MKVLGFFAPVTLLVLVLVAYTNGYIAGWKGGEYAYAFVIVAVGAALVGGVLRLVAPQTRLRSFGMGMFLGGTLGVLITIAVVALLTAALSNLTF